MNPKLTLPSGYLARHSDLLVLLFWSKRLSQEPNRFYNRSIFRSEMAKRHQATLKQKKAIAWIASCSFVLFHALHPQKPATVAEKSEVQLGYLEECCYGSHSTCQVPLYSADALPLPGLAARQHPLPRC